MNMDREERSRGFRALPFPEDFSVRLGRLEDLSGLSLEGFARQAGLPESRAREWRIGRRAPTADEVRAMMEWACRVPGRRCGAADGLLPSLAGEGVGPWDAGSSGSTT